MKTRHGWVSNSSSSSFICDVCGNVEAGFDISRSDAEMSACEKDHEWCNHHQKDREIPFEDKQKAYLKEDCWSFTHLKTDEERVEWRATRETESKDTELVEDWFEDQLSDGETPSEFCPVCTLEVIRDEDLLAYILKHMLLSKEAIQDELRTKFQNSKYEGLQKWLKEE